MNDINSLSATVWLQLVGGREKLKVVRGQNTHVERGTLELGLTGTGAHTLILLIYYSINAILLRVSS